MKKSIAALITLSLLSCTATSYAGASKLKKFSDLDESLINGNIVRAVIEFSKCTVDSPKFAKKNPIGGLSFTEFMRYDLENAGKKTAVIATTDTMLINSEKFGLVYDHLTLRAMDNETVEFVSELVDPKNYASLSQVTYTCSREKGGVTFYEVS